MRRAMSLVVTLVTLTALAACTSGGNSTPNEPGNNGNIHTITSAKLPLVAGPAVTPSGGGFATDLSGNAIVVKDPSRVVALTAGGTELLFQLGLESVIVGRDLTDNQPELQKFPVVTDTHSANLEKILSVSPTLVIVDANTRPISVLEDLANFNIQVVLVPVATDFETAASRILELGEIFNLQIQAKSLSESLEFPFENKSGIKVAFLYLRGQSAIYLLGGKGSGADGMISAAGAIDVGAAANLGSFTPLTPEFLAELNPDVLLVMEAGLKSVGGADGLFAIPGVAQTNAAKTRALVVVEDSLLLSYAGRTADLTAKLNSIFAEMASDD
ncbi:MAG: hypothetical protein RL038_217 [Actinomycetota bacterium]